MNVKRANPETGNGNSCTNLCVFEKIREGANTAESRSGKRKRLSGSLNFGKKKFMEKRVALPSKCAVSIGEGGFLLGRESRRKGKKNISREGKKKLARGETRRGTLTYEKQLKRHLKGNKKRLPGREKLRETKERRKRKRDREKGIQENSLKKKVWWRAKTRNCRLKASRDQKLRGEEERNPCK